MGLVEKLQEKLPQYKAHALSLAAAAVLALSLVRLGPRFLSVVSFFWPLLLSTAFFLTAVVVLRFTSPEAPTSQTAEEFMDFVASRSPLEHDRPEAEGSSGADREDAAAGEQAVEAAAEETKKTQ